MVFSHFAESSYTKSLISLFVIFVTLLLSGCSDDKSSNGLSTMTINWVAPVARSNGDPLPLSEIGGYRIYYGTTTGNYPNQLDIQDATAEQAILTVPSGAYFYVMTTYDVDGRESVYSAENEITVTSPDGGYFYIGAIYDFNGYENKIIT